MLTYEYKIQGTQQQEAAIDEAIRTTQFIRNTCLRLWMDIPGTSKNDLQCHCAVLAKTFPFACHLNSQARQAAADRAWTAIARFYENCQQQKPGKKGYPRFQHDNRSVEYKTSGWKLEADGRHLCFTDGCGIGRVRLIGNQGQHIETFPLIQIKRVRLIRRADGYYAQFVVAATRHIAHEPTGKQIGIDLGLKAFFTDSQGSTVAHPRYLRKAERRLKRLHRRLSRTRKGSANRARARKALGKAHLKVNRQREDFARKTANALVTSHDLIAYEDLQIRNLVKNHHLAKSISDASWSRFLMWLTYYGALHEIPVIAVSPAWTTQACSRCGTRVRKSLSVRTHCCTHCGLVLDRDRNAAINILAKAFDRTGGQSGTGSRQRGRNASGQTAATRHSSRKTGKQAG